jgi:hypothetical protein
MSDEFVSKLPVYQAKRSKDFPAFLIVYCGHDDCPGTKAGRPFLVSEREWMRPNRIERISPRGRPIVITGRSCPYCFRTGRLPRRSDIG